ncbi:MAG TPA: DUF4147 domain-containing protein, partial [Pirellulales bacterium]
MPHTLRDLRGDAVRIWQAGLDAVRSEKLMREAISMDGDMLVVRDLHGERTEIDLHAVRRIAVVGAGKAGAGMAAALEEILGAKLAEEKQLSGWVNVPAGGMQLELGDVQAKGTEENTAGRASSGTRAESIGSPSPSPRPSPARGEGEEIHGLAAAYYPIATSRIHLHPARPAGVNEPTAEGVRGAEEILRLVGSLTADDL